MRQWGVIEAILQACERLEQLLRFGSDVGLLNDQNVATIIVEILALKTAMPEVRKTTGPMAVPLEDIFAASSDPVVYRTAEIIEAAEPAQYEASESGNDESGNRESGNAANRQTAILQRIRQNGNCRIRDIQELLPGSSERTIRYDLQSLLAQGLIERVGGGGPAVYYRIRQTA